MFGFALAMAVYACAGRASPLPGATSDDADLCRRATSQAEASHHIPDMFLDAIARVETGRPDPRSGSLTAWPWSVNAQGVGSFYASKAEAVASVRALQARGVKSIDVGCLQVNLLQHAEAFTTLERAFDPQANAEYAADFLVSLFGQTGSWPRAAAAYHSLTPGIGSPYQARVLAEWAVPQSEAREVRRPRHQEPAIAMPKPTPAARAAPPVRLAQAAPPAPFFASPGRLSAVTPPPAARPSGFMGRSLAAYRATPTRLALRTPG